MSNPTTNFLTGGVDLSSIFMPLSQGSAYSSNTGYTVNNNDLNTIFAKYVSGTKANPTGYTVNNTDLSDIFAKYSSKTTFTTTNQLLTTPYNSNKNVTTLASNFKLPSGYQYFNFILYGGGGDGYEAGATSTAGTGGGGSGSWIHGLSINYNYNGEEMLRINYKISGGGRQGEDFSTEVEITYESGKYLILKAGSGKATTGVSGTTGGAGGIASHQSTVSQSPPPVISSVNGQNGGNQGSNGSSSGYTSSGSGNNGDSSVPIGNPPTASQTYNAAGTTYTINSHGGGKTQVVSGYGAGGAATPANYQQNASAYRYGKPGCILYYLS